MEKTILVSGNDLSGDSKGSSKQGDKSNKIKIKTISKWPSCHPKRKQLFHLQQFLIFGIKTAEFLNLGLYSKVHSDGYL